MFLLNMKQILNLKKKENLTSVARQFIKKQKILRMSYFSNYNVNIYKPFHYFILISLKSHFALI